MKKMYRNIYIKKIYI